MNRGYIKLWRKMQDNEFWKEPRVYSKAEAWIDLLWEAQHSPIPQSVHIAGRTLICNQGESLKSLETWGRRWTWEKTKVRRFLGSLKKRTMIATVNETVTLRITICNYQIYNNRGHESETVSATVTATPPPRFVSGLCSVSPPDKNVNNAKNEKNEKTDPASNGTETTQPPTNPPLPSPVPKPPKETWLTPYNNIWRERLGGDMPFARAAKALAPLHRDPGPERICKALAWYLKHGEARYITIEHFAGRWLKIEREMKAKQSPF